MSRLPYRSWGLAVAKRPSLWPTALRVAMRLAPTRWWAHWPPHLVPPDDYLRFRSLTNSGSESFRESADFIRFLEWSKATHRALR